MLFCSLFIFQHGAGMVVFEPLFFMMTFQDFSRTLEVNKFVSVDFQTQISIWFLINMKFCIRIINKKRWGIRKCISAETFSFGLVILTWWEDGTIACLLFYLVIKMEVLGFREKPYQIWQTSVKAFKKNQNARQRPHKKSQILLYRFLDEYA